MKQLLQSVTWAVILTATCILHDGQAQPQPKKYAFIVGINKYQSTSSGVHNLNFAGADAETLAIVFKSLGYEVTKVADDAATRRRIISELHRYAYEVNERDDFVLFFSGHGMRDRTVGKTFWLTYDAEPTLLDFGGIRLDHLMDYLNDIKAGHKLILLDHCFSGDVSIPGMPLTSTASNDSTSSLSGSPLAVVSKGGSDSIVVSRNAIPDDLKSGLKSDGNGKEVQGMVVIAAARNEAYEPPNLGHGVFTYALVRALTSRQADSVDIDAKLSVEELKGYLHRQVKRLAQQYADKDQDIVETTAGQNLNTWFVADPLPLDHSEQSGRKKSYTAILLRWEGAGWLSLDNGILCRAVLARWAQSPEPSPALDEKETKVLNEIITHMGKAASPPPSISEPQIANSLNDRIEQIRMQ